MKYADGTFGIYFQPVDGQLEVSVLETLGGGALMARAIPISTPDELWSLLHRMMASHDEVVYNELQPREIVRVQVPQVDSRGKRQIDLAELFKEKPE